jgi:hypothetical protein
MTKEEMACNGARYYAQWTSPDPKGMVDGTNLCMDTAEPKPFS